MLSYVWWLLGYKTDEIIEGGKNPEEIIENIKKVDIIVYSKELAYANVVAELKSKLVPKDY